MRLNYGKITINFEEPDNFKAWDVILPPEKAHISINKMDVTALLESKSIELDPNATIGIAVNDDTRPVDYDLLLSPLLEWLDEYNSIKLQNIEIFISTGTHLPISKDKFESFLPKDIVEQYVIVSHNCDDQENMVSLGVTSKGTPVSMNKRYFSKDFKIAIGNIEPHHFMGFSGGIKTTAIGLAGRETIAKNHAFLTHPDAVTAKYFDNPMRQDLEEIGEIAPIDLCLNAVLDYKKDIVDVLLDSPKQVMLNGIETSRQYCQTSVQEDYDVVIACAGGFPKDINLYQAQKAISNATGICRPGGTILLVAECREGHGSQKFFDFMQGVSSYDEVFEKFEKQPFEVGPHKALLIARQGKIFKLALFSSLPDEITRHFLFEPVHDIQKFLSRICTKDTNIAVLPYAASTLPMKIE